MKISRRKFDLATKLSFAGFTIDASSGEVLVSPDPARLEAIQLMDVPRNKKQVREFLGMVRTTNSWYPEISARSNLLRTLSNKNTKFTWLPEHTEEFERLNKLVSDISVLSPYDPSLPLHLMTDASREGGLGFILMQPNGDKNNILECGSATLTPAQRNYSIVELELLAVVWSLEKCEYFTKGAPLITVLSDHASLAGLERRDLSQIYNGRLVRMLERTRGFNIDIKHVKGLKIALRTRYHGNPLRGLSVRETFRCSPTLVWQEQFIE